MALGPGKYDDVATYVRVATDAKAVVVIVIGGDKGSGFSIQAEVGFVDGPILTKLLRDLADEIEFDIKKPRR